MLSGEENHRRAGELFHRLIELPEHEREAALNAAPAELREPVRRLLRADAAVPGEFLRDRAIEAAAAMLLRSTPELTGRRLGSYELLRRAGSGGMGTVYEAKDTRLNRRAAIKILPPEFALDSDRLRRFRQESQAISLLNHPNIVTIYDADVSQGLHYIAMEFVEGRTLRELAAGGLLDTRDIVRIAIQVCAALDAAHGAGVLHRDIKPENIMVRPDGVVKVLDFGLAKVDAPDSGSMLQSRPGTVAGTVHYLSPEQVLGKPALPQSDLFTLGAVLYELACGKRPFDGPTDGAIFNAILHSDPPPPRQSRPRIEEGLETLILRALAKDPELRPQTARDFRSALLVLERQSGGSGSIPAVAKLGWGWRSVAAAVGLALLAGLGGGWLLRPTAPAKLPVRFDPLQANSVEAVSPSLTPGGNQFVYAARPSGNWDIFLQRTGGVTAVNVTPDSPLDDTEPALSRDGTRLAFRSERDGGGVWISELTGENPRRISARGHLPAWSPDGKFVVYSTDTFRTPGVRGPAGSRLVAVDIATGAERTLATGYDAIQPSWSPHGHRIAYWGIDRQAQRDLYTISAAPGAADPIRLTHDAARDWNPVWSAQGDEIYFLSDRGGSMNVWRIPVDQRTGRPHGEPVPVTAPSSRVLTLTAPPDGTGFIFAEMEERTNLYTAGFDSAREALTGKIEPIGGANPPIVFNFSFSPDGRHLVHDMVGATQEDIWIANADLSQRRRLTEDAPMDRMPVWSPAGDEIAFFSGRTGRLEHWIIRPDGGGRRQLTDNGPVQRIVWSPDGKRLLGSGYPGSAHEIDPASREAAREIKVPRGLEKERGIYFWQWSKDGEIVVGDQNTERGQEIIWYWPAAGKLERTGVRGRSAAWLPGPGRRFAFVRQGDCFVYDPVRRTERLIFSVAPNEIYKVDFTQPGRVYFTQTIHRSQIWLARFGH